MSEMIKRCGRCGEVKPVTAFAIRGDRPCGRRSVCLACDRAKARGWYERNRARALALRKARYWQIRYELLINEGNNR